MIYFIIMIVFSPFTAVIPAVYVTNLLFRKKLKVEMNYWNIGKLLVEAQGGEKLVKYGSGYNYMYLSRFRLFYLF